MKVIVGGIIEKNGKYLLVQEAKEKCYKKWNFPAGHLDFNESLEQGAIREIKEETGCDVELDGVCYIANRYCKQNNIEADLYLAIESGINDAIGRWMIINIAVIEDNNNFESYGTSPSFPVPDKTDLSQVMNKIFGKDDERHNKGGGIQLLTHNKVSRIDLTEMAFIMALTKYINKDNWC